MTPALQTDLWHIEVRCAVDEADLEELLAELDLAWRVASSSTGDAALKLYRVEAGSHSTRIVASGSRPAARALTRSLADLHPGACSWLLPIALPAQYTH